MSLETKQHVASHFAIFEEELVRARKLHPNPINDIHQAYAILLEETEELEEAFKTLDPAATKKEAIQVGAVCFKICYDYLQHQQFGMKVFANYVEDHLADHEVAPVDVEFIFYEQINSKMKDFWIEVRKKRPENIAIDDILAEIVFLAILSINNSEYHLNCMP